MKAVLYNRILLALGFLGLFVAGYLSVAHAMQAIIPCGASGGCDKVTSGPGSQVAGIPVAYLGALGYLLLTGLAVVRSIKGLEATRKLVMPGYVVAAVGTAASLYLQYLALVVIGAVCVWCLASAVTMVVTLVVYALLAQTMEDAEVGTVPADKAAIPTVGALSLALAIGLGGGAFSLKSSGQIASGPIDASKIELVLKDSHTVGAPDAGLTIVEFADMYCPSCRTNSPKLKEFVKQNPAHVRMVFRHFPLLNKHPLALKAALISEVAGEKGKFWDFLLSVMTAENLGNEDEVALFGLATKNGLNADEIKKRIADAKDPIYQRVRNDMVAADGLGLQGTPTFILVTEGGKKTEIAGAQEVWDKLQQPYYKDIIVGKAK